MTERPILFSGPMVRAILDGRKTQTRRIMKPQPNITPECDDGIASFYAGDVLTGQRLCPYGQPGDRLWVRETFIHGMVFENGAPVFDYVQDDYVYKTWYRADGDDFVWHDDDGEILNRIPWKPSIHMRRALSRILLEIASVRVERLQEISEADAQAEGVYEDEKPGFPVCSKRQWFRVLWESINGADSWNANPWVWVVEFRKVPHETN